MKATGLTVSQLQKAVHQGLSYGHKLNGSLDADGTFEGWIKVPLAGAKYVAAKSDGTLDYRPCVHGYQKVWQALREQEQAGTLATGWRLRPFGPTKVRYTSGGLTWSKVREALKNKGYTCSALCPVGSTATMAPASASASTASIIATPEPPAPPSGAVEYDCPSCQGAPIAGGEAANPSALSGLRRDLFASVATMYALEELYAAAMGTTMPARLSEVPDSDVAMHHARLAWAKRLVAYRKGYAARLARNFFDFTVLASYSEAKHSSSGYGDRYMFPSASGSGGGSIIAECARFDPRTILPKLAWAFRRKLGHGYGGEKWAKICETGAQWFKLDGERNPVVFADHCVDMSHNSGTFAFNKGYCFTNPSSSQEREYIAMLDSKRIAGGSVLGANKPLTVTPECYELIYEACRVGLLAQPRAPLSTRDDTTVPTVIWGTRTFKVYRGATCPSDTPDVMPVPPHVAAHVGLGSVLDALQPPFASGHGPATLAPPRP